MNPLLFAFQDRAKPTNFSALPEVDSTRELVGNLFYLAPVLALTVLGMLVLIYDFSILRRKPSSERQSRLGVMTLFGLIGLIAGQAWLMLPMDLGGFDMAKLDIPMFSGTIRSDGVSAWMDLTIFAMLALVVMLSLVWNFTEHWGEYFALLCWAGVGMMFLVASEELITLFLTLEMMTLCLYLASAFEKSRRRSAEAGLKYFVYGSVSSALFLFGLSLIYGLTGTTRLDAIRIALGGGDVGNLPVGLSGNVAGATAVLLLLVGFGFKIAAVPFHQWAPDAYEGAPAPVTAWIATGSKIASIVALMKVIVGSLAPWAMRGESITSPGWIGVIAAISAITMTYGNFAALAQKNLKRMLAYSSIAHAGYMLVGVLAASVSTSQYLTSAPVLYYLIIYAFATVGAFALAAWLVRDRGTDEIEDLNGLGYRYPAMAICIVLLMLSLIGMPPLAGFMGKYYMFSEAMNSGERGRIPLTWVVMLGLFNSVVSAFYYVRVLKAMFLRDPSGKPMDRPGAAVALPILVATVASVGFGLWPQPLVDAMRAASSTRATPTAKYVTGADPTKYTTEEQRKAYYAEEARKFREAGGGAGMGGPPMQTIKTPGQGSGPITPQKGQGTGAPGKEQDKGAGKAKKDQGDATGASETKRDASGP